MEILAIFDNKKTSQRIRLFLLAPSLPGHPLAHWYPSPQFSAQQFRPIGLSNVCRDQTLYVIGKK
jgi:hypothetical protein